MEIHKPRPVRDWREFLTEVGIIVIGVLIAMTAETVVDNLRWAERTRQTKEHLRAELHLIAVDALTERELFACNRTMLETVERALVESGTEWRPPYVEAASYGGVPFPSAGGQWNMPDAKSVITEPPARWNTQAWRNAQADGTANHMSQKDNAAFGRMYEVVGSAKTLGDRLQTDISELNALSRPQRLDPASRAEYLRVIGRVRGALSNGVMYSAEILQRADKLNVAKPQLDEEGNLELAAARAYCRQFHDGKTDMVYEVPTKKLLAGEPRPLPPE